jgi:hypothetical protein
MPTAPLRRAFRKSSRRSIVSQLPCPSCNRVAACACLSGARPARRLPRALGRGAMFAASLLLTGMVACTNTSNNPTPSGSGGKGGTSATDGAVDGAHDGTGTAGSDAATDGTGTAGSGGASGNGGKGGNGGAGGAGGTSDAAASG